MIKAAFIAPSHQQADYWARQWGYRPTEWQFIGHKDWSVKIYGNWNPEYPVFIVGSLRPPNEMIWELEMRGYVAYDGQDLKMRGQIV